MAGTEYPALSGPLPWQWPQWRRLARAIADDRLPHALLLAGRPGGGKRVFAEALAARLLCEAPDPEGRACGRCRGCRLLAADNHPDILRLEPQPDKESIVIDQVRELIGQVDLSAQQGGHRVVVIDPAERLNQAAANALLKVLEEPGRGVVFCLVCSRPGALPATVRSRCQRLGFPMPLTDEALEWIAEWVPDRATALDCLASGFGAPLPALGMALASGDGAVSEPAADLLALVRGERGPVEQAEAWLKNDGKRSLNRLMACLSRLLRRHLAPNSLPDRSDRDEAERELSALLAASDPDAHGLFALVDRCLEALRLQETSLNPILLFEQIAIEWLRLCRSDMPAGRRSR